MTFRTNEGIIEREMDNTRERWESKMRGIETYTHPFVNRAWHETCTNSLRTKDEIFKEQLACVKELYWMISKGDLACQINGSQLEVFSKVRELLKSHDMYENKNTKES